MRRTQDLSGQRFGMLTVLSQTVEVCSGKKKSFCRCLCDCGRETVVRTSKLAKKDGTAPKDQTRSCGCIRTLGDLTGKRFGRLIVEREHGRNDKGEITWECLCDCGNKKIVSGSHLKSGRVVSCGCARAEWYADHVFSAAGIAAARSPDAIAKRVETRYGVPGSEARSEESARLHSSLADTYAQRDRVNVDSVMCDRPAGNNPYRGVSYSKSKKCWVAYCRVKGTRWAKYGFKTPEAAKEARDKKQKELIELTGVDQMIARRKEYLDGKGNDIRNG